MSRGAYFEIRLRSVGLAPEHAYRLAKECEQILRDRAPAGIEIEPLAFHASKFSPRTISFIDRVRNEARRRAESEREQRLRTRLEQAAERVDEDIEVL